MEIAFIFFLSSISLLGFGLSLVLERKAREMLVEKKWGLFVRTGWGGGEK